MKLKKILTGALVALGLAFSAFNADAACSNYTAYSDGQVLTAGSLNSLQTNYTNCYADILDGQTFTGNMLWHSGTDIQMFSDTGSTIKALIDGATGAAILGITAEGFHTNCGISNSGTTLSLHGYDGTALSATNPCVMGIRSNTAGRTALAYFTANQTITHGATSDSDGNLFGISAAAWGSTMPMFGGVVYDGTTPYIISGRKPLVVTGSGAGTLAQKGDTDGDGENDQIIWTTGLTLASWVNLPVTGIFWFDATADASANWTFAVTGQNGFNTNWLANRFTYPVSQNGAVTSYHIAGTTPPTWATAASIDYTYWWVSPREVCIEFATADAGNCTNGTGGSGVNLTVPYGFEFAGGTSQFFVAGYVVATGGTAAATMFGGITTAGDLTVSLHDSVGTALISTDFGTATDDIWAYFCYAVDF